MFYLWNPYDKTNLIGGKAIHITSFWVGFLFLFLALSWFALSCFACLLWVGFLFLFFIFLDVFCRPFSIFKFYFIFMQSFIAWVNSTKTTDIFSICSLNFNGEESFPSPPSEKFLLPLLNYSANWHRTLVSYSFCPPNFMYIASLSLYVYYYRDIFN